VSIPTAEVSYLRISMGRVSMRVKSLSNDPARSDPRRAARVLTRIRPFPHRMAVGIRAHFVVLSHSHSGKPQVTEAAAQPFLTNSKGRRLSAPRVGFEPSNLQLVG
jgi:hypothetical protein